MGVWCQLLFMELDHNKQKKKTQVPVSPFHSITIYSQLSTSLNKLTAPILSTKGGHNYLKLKL